MVFLAGKPTTQRASHNKNGAGEQKWQFLLQEQLPNEALQPAILTKLRHTIQNSASALAIARLHSHLPPSQKNP